VRCVKSRKSRRRLNKTSKQDALALREGWRILVWFG
jgi:transposase